MKACEDISFALSANQFTFNTSLASPSDPNKAKKQNNKRPFIFIYITCVQLILIMLLMLIFLRKAMHLHHKNACHSKKKLNKCVKPVPQK